jgi:hypothetical protein
VFISTSACGGFDVSIKYDFLAERYILILHEYIHLHNNMYEHTDILHHERVKYTKKLTVCLSVCGRAAGLIGLCSNKDSKCVIVVFVIIRCPYLLSSHVQCTRYEYFFLNDYYYVRD